MAGSYAHIVGRTGELLNNENFVQMIENLGDAYEAVREMYGMIWYLAEGNVNHVNAAQANWREGIKRSPGRQKER